MKELKTGDLVVTTHGAKVYVPETVEGNQVNVDLSILFPQHDSYDYLAGENNLLPTPSDSFTVCNFDGLPAEKLTRVNFPSLLKISGFENADKLTNLKDNGTVNAVWLRATQLTAETINSLFTQLPQTNKVATINVTDNPGSATCDPSIATAKGYIVTV